MTPVPVELSQVALADLTEIFFYIERRSSKNARIVVEAFEQVLERLSVVPTIGHIHPEIKKDWIRFVPFKSFEAAYRFDHGTVRIIRVVYSARDSTKIDWR